MIFDEDEKVWRTANGRGFGIISDGLYSKEKRHLLKICNEVKYREFDLINFCRDFKNRFGEEPTRIKATLKGLQSINTKCLKSNNNFFEIGEFTMMTELLSPESRNDYLQISCEPWF